MKRVFVLLVGAVGLCFLGCDCGTTPPEEEASETKASTAFSVVSGGNALASENYLCTLTIGDVPAAMPAIESESYRVRLGAGPRIDQ